MVFTNLYFIFLSKILFPKSYETDPLAFIAFFVYFSWVDGRKVPNILHFTAVITFRFLETLFWTILFQSKSRPDINNNKKDN